MAMTRLRVASFNVENLFERAKVVQLLGPEHRRRHPGEDR